MDDVIFTISLLVVIYIYLGRACALSCHESEEKLYISQDCSKDYRTVSIPCMTLSEYSSQINGNSTSWTTLLFLPGIHHLDTVLSPSHLVNFAMIKANMSSSPPEIICTGRAHFEFREMNRVCINGLKITSCIGNLVESVESCVIKDSTIIRRRSDNDENKRYSQAHLESLVSFNLRHSTVMFNPTSFNKARCAISFNDCNLLITRCNFIQNSLKVGYNNTVIIRRSNFTHSFAKSGGSFFIDTNNTIDIHSCNFVNNSAQLGGALDMNSSNIVRIYNSNFTNNTADYGGSIAIGFNNLVYINNSNFLYNGAKFNGGALQMYSRNNVTICGSRFMYNAASRDGGAIYINTNNNVTVLDSNFVNNIASMDGGAVLAYIQNSITVLDSHLTDNTARQDGGAVYVYVHNNFIVLNSHLICNTANEDGGALFLNTNNHITVHDCQLMKNRAKYYSGGAINVYDTNVFTLSGSYFAYNTAGYGGAVGLGFGNNVSISSSNFSSNEAEMNGGALQLYDSNKVDIENINFNDNTCNNSGGAIIVLMNNIFSISRSSFTSNIVYYDGDGGAICVMINNTVHIDRSRFSNNHADRNGGAVAFGIYQALYINHKPVFIFYTSRVTINNSVFTNNSATIRGGAFYANQTDIWIRESFFSRNSASLGALLCAYNTSVRIAGNTEFSANTGEQGIMLMVQCQVNISGHMSISDNFGSIIAFNSHVTLDGESYFFNNRPYHLSEDETSSKQEGGSITTFKSVLTMNGKSRFTCNSALIGGAIFAMESSLYLRGNTTMDSNQANIGGAIFIVQSEIDSFGNNVIINNTALEKGGGIHAIGTTVSLLGGALHVVDNKAHLGGGINLEFDSKIIVFKHHPVYQKYSAFGKPTLKFVNNTASYGGALYVSDDTRSNKCGNEFMWSLCFFQEYALYYIDIESQRSVNIIDTEFLDNKAEVAGGSLYGGLLDRCRVSAYVESYEALFNESNGISYFKSITDVKDDSISSAPVRICFCRKNIPNCSYVHPTIRVKKGELFNVSLIAVDQIGNPITHMNSITIYSSMKSNEGSILNQQRRQYVLDKCTQLHYSIISPNLSEQLLLFAEGPCNNQGISERTITVKFMNCTCPVGFQKKPINTTCECECDQRIQRHVKECFSNNQTLLREGVRSWISYLNSTTPKLNGFITSSHCPSDYCVPPTIPVYINLVLPNGSDALCSFERSGKLCGSCKDKLSVTFGGSRCMPCSNNWLALLVPFSITGIVLVIFILVLNLTVASGTVNGLIFYANVIVANRAIFLPFNKTNVLTVFIAWLNLDLGLETCFYNGMNTYAKTWLQIAFPLYVMLLIIAVILICEYFQYFSTLIGQKNPIATLATLFLLSYAKLLRTIITVLSFTYLDCPDGSRQRVWLFDANVRYLQGKHIPLFIAAILIIAFSIVYTLLLLMFQWLPYFSKVRGLKWVNNTKLKALMDAYHAPYNPRHRYWAGLLLLARVVLYLVLTLNRFGNPNINLLAIFCTSSCLLSFKIMCTSTKIYKNWALDSVDTSFLINLLFLTGCTFYYSTSDQFSNQSVLAFTSLGIAFATFIGIFLVQFYSEIISKVKTCRQSVESINQLLKIDQTYRRTNRISSRNAGESKPLLYTDHSEYYEPAELRPSLEIFETVPCARDYHSLEAGQRHGYEEGNSILKPQQKVTHTTVEITTLNGTH